MMVAIASEMTVPVSVSISWTRASPTEQAVSDIRAGVAVKAMVPASAESHASPAGARCSLYPRVIALSGEIQMKAESVGGLAHIEVGGNKNQLAGGFCLGLFLGHYHTHVKTHQKSHQ